MTAAPLTPDEERELRELNARAWTCPDDYCIARLLATLDAERTRAARGREIVKRLGECDPFGVFDYESDWSEVTPGDGPTYGCLFCRSEFGRRGRADCVGKLKDHAPDCPWRMAREQSD